MPIVPDLSGNNPGNPDTNGWTGVDAHNQTTEELQRAFYASGGTSDFLQDFLSQVDGPSARAYLGTNDAANLTTGILDPARIPVITSAVQIVSTSATIAGLSAGEQALVKQGCVLTLTDGTRWTYTGTGSKTDSGSYIQLSDVTPDWTVVQNRPAPATTVANPATGGAGVVGTSVNYAREDHAHQFPLANLNAQTGTTYTLTATDHGKIVELSNTAGIALTLPNSLPVGFNCMICQVNTGQVTISAAVGATMHNRASLTKTAGQYAEVSIRVRTNAGGSAAEYVVSGDMA